MVGILTSHVSDPCVLVEMSPKPVAAAHARGVPEGEPRATQNVIVEAVDCR